MIKKSLTKKVHGGKLFRLDVSFSDKVENIKITGDFFLHPEDFLLKVEECLRGISTNLTSGEILSHMDKELENEKYELIGVSFSDISSALYEVISSEE